MNTNKLSKPLNMWIAAAVCCLLWGSAFPAIKIGYKLIKINSSDTPSIILFAGVRFFIAGVLTIIIFSAIQRKPLLPVRGSFKNIAVLAVFQTVLQYVFFYLGLAFTSGERASVINSSSVFFAIIISAFIFKSEKLSVNKIFGSVIGFAGVILVSLGAFTGGNMGIKGELFILISSISYAFSSNFIKIYSKKYEPAMLSGWQFVLGGAFMSFLALVFGGRLENVNIKGILVIIYLALVSAVAYSLWSMLLKYNDVSKVAVCSFMTPVFGYILSSLFSSEGDNTGVLLTLIALILVVAGTVIVNFNFKAKNE